MPLVKQEETNVSSPEGGKQSGKKPKTSIVTQSNGGDSGKQDDCSDLTDNNPETDDSTSKSFPQKLLDILSNEEYSEIISWLPHGNGFLIHKKKSFANEILPKHFKASKFTSFTRKLNRWGFSRAPRGPETGAYFHKFFCREKPEMVLQMTSNSGNKYQNATQGGPLLPTSAVPMMMGATPGTMPAMPFYMPPPQMAMLTPQQQQTLWQQQMQLYQFQQMQMFQFQQQQQAAGTNGTPPPMPPGMMMMMPHPMMPMPTAAIATTPESGTKKTKKEAEDSTDKVEGEDAEDYHDAVDAGIDAEVDSNKVGV